MFLFLKGGGRGDGFALFCFIFDMSSVSSGMS